MTNVSTIKTPLSLFEEYMQAQGLDAADRERMGLALLDASGIGAKLGMGMAPGKCGVLIPYGGDTRYNRVRLLGALARGSSKYLSAKGSGHGPLYLPPWEHIDWNDVRADVGQMVCVVEGEIKSYWGCRSGEVACVGIGGVDMQEGLFNSSWEWKGRRVLVCFDKDSGWESGTWKPGVARALGKLCARLGAEGASVWVLALPGGVEEKCGLDDYLRAGMGWPALLETAGPPPEWCEHMAWMLEQCVYVRGTNHAHVYTLTNGSRKSVDDFHISHVEKIRKGEDGKKGTLISRLWLHHPDRQTVEDYVMNPLLPKGITGNMLNLWEPFPSFGDELNYGVVEGWQRFMEGLFGEHWQWVASWVGHMLERPEEKCTQAVMLVTSVQGIGKSLFGDVVRDIMGVHGLECGVERMFSKFNAEMEGRVFVMVNELDVKFSAREGQLNELLTTENVYVEQKGKDVMVFPNLRRWYLTTNSASPCRLSRGQRRVLVISPPRVGADTRGEWGRWVGGEVAGWRRSGAALGAIAGWFRDRYLAIAGSDGHGWDPTAPVPETAAGEELALASRTSVQVLADHALEWIEERGMGAIGPMRKKTDAKLCGEIILRVRGAGGLICQKVVKLEGKAVAYTTFEWRDGREPLEHAANRTIKSALSAEQVRELDEDLWSAVFGLKTQLGGG